MKSNLITVNLKKTENVDWMLPLGHYLSSVYGSLSDFGKDLHSFTKLRQDIKGTNLDATGKDLHYKYYGQLEFLDLRIPFHNIQIDFTWYDAFQPTIASTQHSLAFEKASILFNLAALLSTLGKTNCDDSNYKESIKHFQYAAGVYKFLIDNFLHAPSNDLNQQTVKFLCKLMVSQGQEVFLLKLINENSEKYSLLAKLCQSCTNHYSSCYEAITSTSTNVEDDNLKVPAKIDQIWINLIELKLNFYKSLVDYYQGLYSFESNRYGEAIAYLRRSNDSIYSITRKNLGPEFIKFQENIKTQKTLIKEKLSQIEKDNDFVFHDVVPSVSSLSEVKSMDSVKIIPLNEQSFNDSIGRDFFEKVIPMNIHELNSLYSEEQSSLVRGELESVEISNEELNSVLEYLKLPKALIFIKQSVTKSKSNEESEVDPELTGIASEVSQNEGKNQENRTKIADLKRVIYSTLTCCDNLINTAEQNSNDKINFDMNAGIYRDETSKAKKSLIDASDSDNKLFGLVSNPFLLSVLGKGPNSREFQDLVSENSKQNPNESLLDLDDSVNDLTKINKSITALEDLLSDLNNIKRDKNLIISNLKKDIHEDDILQILVLNSKKFSPEEISKTIFKQELAKFKPYQDQLVQLINKQANLINELKRNWSELLNDPVVSELQTKSRRNTNKIANITNDIQSFYKDWKSYTDGLAAGANFYSKLLNYVQVLETNIKLFISNESHKNSSASLSLSNQFSGMSLNPNPNLNQPPIPAKPQFQQNSSFMNQYQQPSYIPTGQFTGTSNSPQLPPKPSDPPSGLSSLNVYGTSQGQQQHQPGYIYSQPSVYDPSLYSSFGNKFNSNDS